MLEGASLGLTASSEAYVYLEKDKKNNVSRGLVVSAPWPHEHQEKMIYSVARITFQCKIERYVDPPI